MESEKRRLVMISHKRSIQQIVEEQVQKWNYSQHEQEPTEKPNLVVTVSREPGSGGKLIASGIAEQMNFDLFHQEVIHEMADSAHVSRQLLETLDEKGLSFLDDWIASFVDLHHLWPDEYLHHLLKVITTIGKHGRAVLVGRGANFVLPQKDIFRLRVIAPLEFRAQKVAQEYDISPDEAKHRVIQTESERRAFIHKYFHQDIAAPENYDLLINTGTLTLQEAVEGVCAILRLRLRGAF
jgi:cytidylate kinase